MCTHYTGTTSHVAMVPFQKMSCGGEPLDASGGVCVH